MSLPLRPVVPDGAGRAHWPQRARRAVAGHRNRRRAGTAVALLNRMIDRLEEALAHNHRFSADASHELRTPLTILQGELETLLMREDLPQTALEGICSALEEIERMSRIVHSLWPSRAWTPAANASTCVRSILPQRLHAPSNTCVCSRTRRRILLTCARRRPVFVSGDAHAVEAGARQPA